MPSMETQGLEVEWCRGKEETGMSFGRLGNGIVRNVGFGRSGRWGRGGNSGSFGTSSLGKGRQFRLCHMRQRR